VSRLDWMNDARCTEIGGEPFFPEYGEKTEEAKNVCSRCPVQTECLTYALTIENTGVWSVIGIWGGTTPEERRQIKRTRTAA